MTVLMLYLLIGCMDAPRLDAASTAEKAAIALRGPILTDAKLNCGLNVAYVTLRSMGYTLSLTELTTKLKLTDQRQLFLPFPVASAMNFTITSASKHVDS